MASRKKKRIEIGAGGLWIADLSLRELAVSNWSDMSLSSFAELSTLRALHISDVTRSRAGPRLVSALGKLRHERPQLKITMKAEKSRAGVKAPV